MGRDPLVGRGRCFSGSRNNPSCLQKYINNFVCCKSVKINKLAALAQMVACLPLVQQVRGSIPGGVVNFHLKIFNLGARRGGDVHFLIARSSVGWEH